jgi:hypothetical protein
MAGTIVVDRIESDSSYTSTINVASKVNFTGGMQVGGQDSTFGGMRNRIINGAMMIDQRYGGSSNTKNAGSGDSYHLDRWLVANAADAVFTVQQVEDGPTGFKNSLKITTTTADASIGSTQINLIRQSIEGLNVSDLAWGTASAKTITLSFWVKSSLTGQFGGSLTNSGANRSRTYSYTINSANTWEYKTIVISGDTSGTWLTTNGVGIRLDWNLGTGSTYLAAAGTWNASNLVGATGDTSVVSTLNATWQITGVQFEVGSAATSFENRLYGTELALCQRYYQIGRFVCFPLMYTNHSGGAGGTPSSFNVYMNEITLGVPMRSAGGTIVPCRYDKAVLTNGSYVSRTTNEGDFSGLLNSSPYLRFTEPNTIFIYFTTSNAWYPTPVYFTASSEL